MRGADIALWPGPTPPSPLVANVFAPYAPRPGVALGAPSTMIAAAKLIDSETGP
jgi:hypothetical protein